MSGTAGAAPRCPLCASPRIAPFAQAHGRRYLDCAECGLVHAAPEDRLGPEAERAHYGTHRNDPADPGYRAFLARVADPLAARLAPGARGLDYGCGPGPALAMMMAERGFPTAVYDPFFAPDAEALRRTYDFITCTETAEHFFEPGDELARLDGLLRPGGILAVMTEVLEDGRDFAGWRYARDPTHVSFYRPRTLRWIAERHGWAMESPSRNVALFGKPGGP
ncbi:MAG TPA: class I SAM-dependent methyltransferase [Longimicrobium sp.]|nr:class I SAM-dependent methyltransferase [Longimicrobium sp.]